MFELPQLFVDHEYLNVPYLIWYFHFRFGSSIRLSWIWLKIDCWVAFSCTSSIDR